MADYQKPMSIFFTSTLNDTPTQNLLRSQYLSMYYNIDNITGYAAAEKSVAKRKLLESMDAAMRAAAQ